MGKKNKGKNKAVKKEQPKDTWNSKPPMLVSLIRDLNLSIKRRGKFGDFIHGHFPIFKCLKDSNTLAYRLVFNPKQQFFIGDSIIYNSDISRFGNYAEASKLYTENIGRLRIINELLDISVNRSHSYRSFLEKKEILRWFMEDEVIRHDIKVYSNHYVYMFLFGGIFATITFFFTVAFLSYIFGLLVGAIYSLIVALLLSYKIG